MIKNTNSELYNDYKINKNKRIFEDIIDELILSNYDNELTKKIKNLDKKHHRIATLAFLDKDRNLFMKIKALVDNNRPCKTEHLKDVVSMLRKYVEVGDVEQKLYGEVMSPLDTLVYDMIENTPAHLWTNPNSKFLDPCNGVGNYPVMIVSKLMNTLSEWEPDEEKRYKHIVENMLYVCELQPKNQFLYLFTLDPYDEYDLNIYTGSYLNEKFDKHCKEVWGVDIFDLIIGNPPYNSNLQTKKGSSKPMYNMFVLKSIKISDYVSMVTPSRWFVGGSNLDEYREFMKTSYKIKYIKHFDNADTFFKNVDIMGGVSYFLYDNTVEHTLCKYNDYDDVDLNKYDVILDPKFHSVIDYVNDLSGLDTICKGASYNKIESNDKRLVDYDENKLDTHYKCFVNQSSGFIKMINKKEIHNIINVDTYKVATAESNGKYKKFGNIFIVKPGEAINKTYISFQVNSLEEAESLVSLLKTRFANFMLSLRKITQHIKPSTCKWIPYLPLDRVWNDESIIAYLNLNEDFYNMYYFSKEYLHKG